MRHMPLNHEYRRTASQDEPEVSVESVVVLFGGQKAKTAGVLMS